MAARKAGKPGVKGEAIKPVPLATKAKANVLAPQITADEAFRLTLQQCKWHILANLPAVTETREVEGVHQLRVALRRLRVALVAFGREFRTPAIEALRMRAKLLAATLGTARDMDVFLNELLTPAEADATTPGSFAALRERAEQRRREAWDDAVREAGGLAFHTFLHDLNEVIDSRQWRTVVTGREAGDSALVFDRPAKAVAARQLTHYLKSAKKRARRLDSLSDSERHQLRIALKKLRYAAELFASLYPPEKVKPFVKRLSQLQDVFGLLQDVAVARGILQAFVAASALDDASDVSFAAGTVYGWHLERANEAWGEAKARWKRFAKVDPFWETA